MLCECLQFSLNERVDLSKVLKETSLPDSAIIVAARLLVSLLATMKEVNQIGRVVVVDTKNASHG